MKKYQSINRKLLKRAEQLGQKLASQRYQAVIEETEVHAIELRKILKNGLSPAKKLEQDLPSSVRSSVHAEDVHL